MRNNVFRKCLYIMSIVSVTLVLIADVFLPKIVSIYAFNVLGSEAPSGILVFLYLASFPFILIGISVVKLSGKLLNSNIFYKSSMKELKLISICSLIDFIIFFVGTFFIYKNLLCLAVMMGTIIVFIISSIVRELIGSGIQLQEDADLTI